MTLRKLAWLGLGTALLATQVGCHCGRLRDDRPSYPPPGAYPPPGTFAPRPGGASPEILTPEPQPPGGSPAPALPPPGTSGFGPTWSPSGPPVPTPRDLLPPSNVPVDAGYTPGRRVDHREPPLAPTRPADPIASGPRLLPPDLMDPRPSAKVPVPSAAVDAAASPALPVIPWFSEVKDRVSNGQKPDPEGLDWLKTNGYRTVLHLNKPGTPHTADREQVEKRGMKYVVLEVSPDTLTASLTAEFIRAVAEPGHLPLFVYDSDGTLAGAMWFAYFRSVEKLTVEQAKAKASAYGLKTADADPLWQAVLKVTRE